MDIVSSSGCAEVEKEVDLKAGDSEVGQNLAFVRWSEGLDSFEFNDHFFFDEMHSASVWSFSPPRPRGSA
jgi:hypothetical protein